MALPLVSVERHKCKGTVLFFRVYIVPLFSKYEIILHSLLLKTSKNPTLSDPLWVPEILSCSTKGEKTAALKISFQEPRMAAEPGSEVRSIHF